MTPGVGPRAAAKLLERFGSAEGVFGALRGELERLRLRPETVESIALRDRHEEAAREVERVREIPGADVLVLDDGAYPALLREIADPPVTLYVRGAWAECVEAPCAAVVGSRRASTYGQNVALMLARDLAARGVTVVSGLARGIDAAAHRGALEGAGRTVAVLGTGIDGVYPRDHRKLADEILAGGGALVSQFNSARRPSRRISPTAPLISGLSSRGRRRAAEKFRPSSRAPRVGAGGSLRDSGKKRQKFLRHDYLIKSAAPSSCSSGGRSQEFRRSWPRNYSAGGEKKGRRGRVVVARAR